MLTFAFPRVIFPSPSPPTLPPRLFSRSHQVYCSPEHKVGHVFSLVARKEQPPSCALTHCLKARFLPCGFCLAINMYNWIAVVAAREHEITNELYELPIGEFAKSNFIRIKFKADFYQCITCPCAWPFVVFNKAVLCKCNPWKHYDHLNYDKPRWSDNDGRVSAGRYKTPKNFFKTPSMKAPAKGDDPIEKISALKKLYDADAIDKEEYETAKAALLKQVV